MSIMNINLDKLSLVQIRVDFVNINDAESLHEPKPIDIHKSGSRQVAILAVETGTTVA